MSKRKGIGYSSLTDKVYIGQQDRKKGIWIGDKEDITNDWLNVAFQYFKENTVRNIVSTNKQNLFINVKKDKESIEKVIKILQKELSDI